MVKDGRLQRNWVLSAALYTAGVVVLKQLIALSSSLLRATVEEII